MITAKCARSSLATFNLIILLSILFFIGHSNVDFLIYLNTNYVDSRISKEPPFIPAHYLMSATCRDRADDVRDPCLKRVRRE